MLNRIKRKIKMEKELTKDLNIELKGGKK